MNEIVEKYKKDVSETLDQEKEKLDKNITFLDEYLPKNLPIPAYQGYSVFHDLWLTYPYDRALMMSVEESFANAGWERVYYKREAEVGKGEHPRMRFQFSGKYSFERADVICEFSDTQEGATCIRKRIGTKRKSEPIYEFVCE